MARPHPDELSVRAVARTAPPPPEGSHPPHAVSLVRLIADGSSAFAARVASARAAESTLDLQYYMWEGDVTGRLLVREALMAADRGVKVRILIDDLYGIGRERDIASLSGHPRISLRWFNTSHWGRWGWFGLMLEFAFGSWHLNRRMHNKAWIADDATVICGGRNIGDRYFDAPADFNFRDLDVAIRGPAAAEATALFETYWRSPLARPLRRLPRMRTRKSALRKLRRKLEVAAAMPEARHVLEALAKAEALPDLEIANDAIRILADPPEKVRGRAHSTIAPVVQDLLNSAKREALLISPYFVPGEAGTEELIALRRRGVRVSVITNSLAATDVVAVHGGYVRYRDRLLAEGVEIHEMKAVGETRTGVFGSRGASLHTKAVLVDDGPVFVGSFNLDPRSIGLNTEMGVLVQHEALARMVRVQHSRLATPERSWKLALVNGRLTWEGATRSEPDATLRRRCLAWLVRWLPVESQL